MTIYDRIRDRRIELGMTQDDLAKAMGYKDRSMITKIEAGKVDISQKKIEEFAKVLNTNEAYLMGWTGTKVLEFISEPQPFHPSVMEMFDKVLYNTPKEDAEMAVLWRHASPVAKRAAIAVLKSMKEAELK